MLFIQILLLVLVVFAIINFLQLKKLRKGEKRFMSTTNTALADLQAQVAKNEQIEESAVLLIKGLADQIIAAGTDPVALKALTDGLTASAGDLAASIAANTPAAPPTT